MKTTLLEQQIRCRRPDGRDVTEVRSMAPIVSTLADSASEPPQHARQRLTERRETRDEERQGRDAGIGSDQREELPVEVHSVWGPIGDAAEELVAFDLDERAYD